MKNDDIRLLAFQNPEIIKGLIVTQNQIKIIKFISDTLDGVFSPIISREFNISIQSSSTILATLYKKGYLDRKEEVHPSGGSQYLYTVRPEFVWS